MAKSKAESLDEVLELARTRRQSGMLTIQHTQGGRVEEGEVYLQAGQPVYAQVGAPVAGNSTDAFAVPSFRPAPSLPQNSQLKRDGYTGPVKERVTGEGSSSPGGSSHTPGVEWLVPQKRGVDRDVLSLPLTRRQRFIYFLVDGRRTISDLSRCTGKNIQEVELILSELQEQGLVAV